MICPNKSSNQWKDLVEGLKKEYGEKAEAIATFVFHRKGDIPSVEEVSSLLSIPKQYKPSATTGLSRAARAERAAELGQEDVEFLKGVTPEEAVQKGQEYLNSGADPNLIASEYANTGKISIEGIYTVFAEADRLAKETNQAADNFGTNSQEYKNAADAERAWKDDYVRKIGNEFFHQVGQRLQADVDIDTGSFAGLRRAFMQEHGMDYTPEEKQEAERIVNNLKLKENDVKNTSDKISDIVNKNAKGKEAIGDILTKYINKKDNNFTPEEVKQIWDYAKQNYIDKGMSYEDMLSGVSKDLGLTTGQINTAISLPKGVRKLSNELYLKQRARLQAISQAKDWVKSAKSFQITKFSKWLPGAFFGLKTFGHGTVGFITHAGPNLFRPSKWGSYFPNFLKQFSYAYGDPIKYAKAMADLKNDPEYTFWLRAKLAVDPDKRYSEYEGLGKYLSKIPGYQRLSEAGDRGFSALKVYRLEMAKSVYAGLSAAEKADPETRNKIAEIVNHSTGTTNVTPPSFTSTVFFAPKLEISRWQRIITDPAKASSTFLNWEKSSPSDKAAAKLVAYKNGEIMAVYAGMLLGNAALNNMVDKKHKVNLTDPTQSDWLKFKAGGATIDATGGFYLQHLMQFLERDKQSKQWEQLIQQWLILETICRL
jgi:PBP1b-binding outer membrane lipoprotein LpoB